jgi:hypothetical protein
MNETTPPLLLTTHNADIHLHITSYTDTHSQTIKTPTKKSKIRLHTKRGWKKQKQRKCNGNERRNIEGRNTKSANCQQNTETAGVTVGSVSILRLQQTMGPISWRACVGAYCIPDKQTDRVRQTVKQSDRQIDKQRQSETRDR